MSFHRRVSVALKTSASKMLIVVLCGESTITGSAALGDCAVVVFRTLTLRLAP
jgi:hypothetical protein